MSLPKHFLQCELSEQDRTYLYKGLMTLSAIQQRRLAQAFSVDTKLPAEYARIMLTRRDTPEELSDVIESIIHSKDL